MAAAVDEAKLEELMGQLVGHMTGGALCFGIWVGDELGLYRALAHSDSLTADEVAGKAGCNARLVREWLDGQAAGGLIGYDPATATPSHPRPPWRWPTTPRRLSSPGP